MVSNPEDQNATLHQCDNLKPHKDVKIPHCKQTNVLETELWT